MIDFATPATKFHFINNISNNISIKGIKVFQCNDQNCSKQTLFKEATDINNEGPAGKLVLYVRNMSKFDFYKIIVNFTDKTRESNVFKYQEQPEQLILANGSMLAEIGSLNVFIEDSTLDIKESSLGDVNKVVPTTPVSPPETKTSTTQMTRDQLISEVAKITALITQLQTQLAQLNNQIATTIQQFTTNLYYGMMNNSEVKRLQQFLISHGYMVKGYDNGNYLLPTVNALKYYQKLKGINPISGYFGPKTKNVINQELSVCDNEQSQAKKDSCYWYLATKTKKDSSVCDNIQDQIQKDICYGDIAEDKQDLSICDNIQNQGRKNNCYWMVAKAKEDLSICNKIQDKDPGVFYKDYCYRDVAEGKQDSSICESIQDQYTKNGCYGIIAVLKQDLSICDKIQDQNTKDRCYWNVAVVKKDLSICAKIEDIGLKGRCLYDGTAIEEGMNQLRIAAEMAYDTVGNYSTTCTNSDAARIFANIAANGGKVTCNVAPSFASYATQSTTANNTTTYYCVDSTGASHTTTTPLGTNAVCP